MTGQAMSENKVLLTFEIALDGTIQNVSGDCDFPVPGQQVIHRLLYAAKKTLVDEEVVSITASSDKYMLSISASGAIFKGVISSVAPTE